MKNYTKSFLVLTLLLVGSLSAYAQDVLVDVTKNYSNISKIEVEGGWLDVKYEGGSSSDVEVVAYLESRDDNQDIVFVTVGDVLKIKFEKKKNNYSWKNNKKGYINITGPKDMDLNVRNSSGQLFVSNVASEETSLKVTSGKVTAENIDGDLTIGATSGKLTINGVNGDVVAGVTSGNATVNQVSGSVEYKATSGSIDAADVGGKLSVSLTSGNARLENIGELGRLKFTSGTVKAENAGLGPDTSFSGTSGAFRITTPTKLTDFNYNLKASSGTVKVGGSSTNKQLKIDNGSGSWIEGSISSGRIIIENL